MNKQQYAAAQQLFETYDLRVANKSLTLASAWSENQAAAARIKRNQLLSQSDWTQLPDAPVDQAAWMTYRQALRDVPAQATFPTTINWPEVPSA